MFFMEGSRPLYWAGGTAMFNVQQQTTHRQQRESKKYPDAGIVLFEHIGFNQHEEIVVTAKRTGLMMKRPK